MSRNCCSTSPVFNIITCNPWVFFSPNLSLYMNPPHLCTICTWACHTCVHEPTTLCVHVEPHNMCLRTVHEPNTRVSMSPLHLCAWAHHTCEHEPTTRVSMSPPHVWAWAYNIYLHTAYISPFSPAINVCTWALHTCVHEPTTRVCMSPLHVCGWALHTCVHEPTTRVWMSPPHGCAWAHHLWHFLISNLCN